MLVLVASCVAGLAATGAAASAGTCRTAVAAYSRQPSSGTLQREAITRCGSVGAWVGAVRATSHATERRALRSLETACTGNDDLTLCRHLGSTSPRATSDPSRAAYAALCASAHAAFAKGQAIPEAESESILVRETALTGSSPEAQHLLDSLRAQPPGQQGDYGLVFIVAPLVKTCNAKGL